MKLIGSHGSPYVRKVRIVLAEKRIPYEFVLARPSEPASIVPEFNPLGQIPVLVRDDGRPLYDSAVIVEYLDGLVSEPPLIPQAFADRIEVRRWEALGDGVAAATVAISHDYREPETQRKARTWYEKEERKITRALLTMATDLGDREYCYGERFTLADIATGYALGYLDRVLPTIDWRSLHPRLVRLADRLALRPSFATTVAPA